MRPRSACRGNQAVLHLKWKRPMRDIAVDGAMRENYRAQFDRVIQRSSCGELGSRMETKLNASAAAPSGWAAPVRRTAGRSVFLLLESP
jgi:hypothetical protein